MVKVSGCLDTVITLGVKVAVELSLLPVAVAVAVAIAAVGGRGNLGGMRRLTGVSCNTAVFLIVCCNKAFTSIAGQATSETLRHKCESNGEELRLRRICLLQGLVLLLLLLLLQCGCCSRSSLAVDVAAEKYSAD